MMRSAISATQTSAHDTNHTWHQDQPWLVTETEFNPEKLNAQETVFTIGNGYLGTRGSFEEGYPGSTPLTLVRDLYDTVPVFYRELVNCPDWTNLELWINHIPFRLNHGEVLSYHRQLNLQNGVLTRQIRWRSPLGQTVDLKFERFADLQQIHVLVLHCEVTAIDFEGTLQVYSRLSPHVDNNGYKHWQVIEQNSNDDRAIMTLRTRHHGDILSMAVQLQVDCEDAQTSSLQKAITPDDPTLLREAILRPGQPITIDKLVTLYTSQDSEWDEVEKPTAQQIQQIALRELQVQSTISYADRYRRQTQTWRSIWQQSNVLIEGDIAAQIAIRYNLFQLIISAVSLTHPGSIPAKTLSGLAYCGHIFWDTEIFILPFWIYTQPQVAQQLLNYRYKTLAGARRKAQHEGFSGAMYAWESADTGDEVTPRWSISTDPYQDDIRIWCRDREIHISADVAYAVWHYWQATGDDNWMRDRGAEIILETAKFWAARAEYNVEKDRYEINEVIGADEYHDLVNNNALTNRLMQWHLQRAAEVHQWLQSSQPQSAHALLQKLHITTADVQQWQDIIHKVHITYDPDTHLIEQFDGFFNLQPIDLHNYEPRVRSMQSILGIEEANEYQVLKQPDVLMLLYLMRMTQDFPYHPEILQRNWDYYAPRTDITLGSSLGPAIHAVLAADLGLTDLAYHHWEQAAMVDLDDLRGNAREGVHGASAGGVWQTVVFGFGGVRWSHDGHLTADPHLPLHWQRLKFKLQWQGKSYRFDITPDRVSIEPTQPRASIDGVIFDLDGVLTDTSEYHYLAWQKLADEFNLRFDRTANEALRGVSRRESLLRILEINQATDRFGESDLSRMLTIKNDYYQELIREINPDSLLPGAQTLLETLKADGIKCAIASSSKNAHQVIQQLGIAHYFEVIADGHSVQHGKPAPDLFQFAAAQLQLDPEHCIVFEDAAAGVAAAIAAGIPVIGLGEREYLQSADLVLPNLAASDWDGIQIQLDSLLE